MSLLWIIVALAGLVFLATRGRKTRDRERIAAIRRHFASIARMRLVAACPHLEETLAESDLRFLFDWILIELFRRTNVSGFDALMRWSLGHGEAEAARLTAQVTREAVDLLPATTLEVIDSCEGRVVAGVLLDESLTEAGHRLAVR